MVQRMARQTLASMRTEVGQLVTPLVGRVDALEKAVTGVTKVTAASTEDAFFAMLDDQVPGWEATNASQPWLDWLASKDPVYGLPRQAALDAAFERKDGRHAVAIFKQFLSEQATPATPEPRPSLESLVAPSAGGGAAVTPSAPEAKPILSQKFIRDFYSHVSRGRYANDPEGQKRISQEIDLAVAEGRVSST